MAAVVTWYALGRPADRSPARAPHAGPAYPATGTVLDLLDTGQTVARVLLLLVALTTATVTGTLVARNLPPTARAGAPRPHSAAPPHARPDPASADPAPQADPAAPPSLRATPTAAELAPYAVLISAVLQGRAVGAVLSLSGAALVLAEFLAAGRWRPPRGWLLGAAVAVQPALVLFVLPVFRRRGRRPALTALAVALALGLAVRLPHAPSAVDPWRSPADPAGRSAWSALLRIGLHGVPLLCVWTALVVTTVVLALRRCSRYHADGQLLLSLAVVGCASVLLSVTAHPADLCWLLLAGLGRLSGRPDRRPLWPLLTATAVLLPTRLLVPQATVTSTALLRDAGVLLTVAAAAVLPFRCRDDPLWQVRRALHPAEPRPRGRPVLPLLPPRLRPRGRPDPLVELLVIQVGYGIYSFIRNAAPTRGALAVDNAEQVHHLEQLLHLDVEGAVNGWVLSHGWLLELMLHYYRVVHFVMPLAVLIWLYLARPDRYRTSRTVLCATTGLALVGYWGLPLAPPRLTPGLGLRETLAPAAPGSGPSALTALTNQYAAMPSLHIAWALWCALAVVTATRNRWVRAAALSYPSMTLLVVLGTANHWVLDAVAGTLLVVLGCLSQYALTGRRFMAPELGRPRTATPPRRSPLAPGAARTDSDEHPSHRRGLRAGQPERSPPSRARER
ncbi:phosphatase PAP2 family protein [Kitasatospora purpeofusca]|uniref:phosphatase PAP2 family protein n=1 Tax=Kitasatospora purpeofusca TaxID=67352 RepID=UPI0036EEE25B